MTEISSSYCFHLLTTGMTRTSGKGQSAKMVGVTYTGSNVLEDLAPRLIEPGGVRLILALILLLGDLGQCPALVFPQVY